MAVEVVDRDDGEVDRRARCGGLLGVRRRRARGGEQDHGGEDRDGMAHRAAAQRRFALAARALVLLVALALAAAFAGLAAFAAFGLADAAPRLAHSCREAMRAPSASAASFAPTMLSCTSSEPAKVAKPQSEPAITFSRPTMSA